MKILVTGAKGFVGRNLCANLRNIQDGKDRRFPGLKIEGIFEYDLDSTPEQLDVWCRDADFVFNLAGVTGCSMTRTIGTLAAKQFSRW